jgi:hypothetical protein
MYLDQKQQGMVKRVLVMRQQHCGTPYQTTQGVFQLLGSSKFLFRTGISQKIVLVAHVNCDLLLLPQNKAFDASCSLFTLNMLFAYVLCLSLCFYLCYETLS